VEKKKKFRIGLASDHAGYIYKQQLIRNLENEGYHTRDFGCDSEKSCDYPDYAHPLAGAVQKGEVNMGISLCGSGNGINMVVNKYRGVRSAICWNKELARLARAHNDANICAMPGRFITLEEGIWIVKAFLSTDFEGGRHLRRVKKIALR